MKNYSGSLSFFWINTTCSDFLSLATFTIPRKILALPRFNIFFFLRAWNQHQGKRFTIEGPSKWRFKHCLQSCKWWVSEGWRDFHWEMTTREIRRNRKRVEREGGDDRDNDDGKKDRRVKHKLCTIDLMVKWRSLLQLELISQERGLRT